jgi:hypothetical protein
VLLLVPVLPVFPVLSVLPPLPLPPALLDVSPPPPPHAATSRHAPAIAAVSNAALRSIRRILVTGAAAHYRAALASVTPVLSRPDRPAMAARTWLRKYLGT